MVLLSEAAVDLDLPKALNLQQPRVPWTTRLCVLFSVSSNIDCLMCDCIYYSVDIASQAGC